MHITRSFIRLLPLVLLLISCNAKEAKPVTKEEAMDFAQKVEMSIGNREETFLNEAIDADIMLKRADLPNGKDTRSFKEGFSNKMRLGTVVTKAISNLGTYSFVKEYENDKDKSRHVIFRMYEDGKLNYHDMELVKVKGATRVADIYIYITGEKLSETLSNFYLQVSTEVRKTGNDDLTWMKKIPEMRDQVQQQNYREALDIYNTIPGKMKTGKLVQVMHISICSGLSNDEYAAALDEYQELFPNEPNTALLMLDGYVIHEEYDKALAAVNQLDKQINTDPFLDYYRYLCYNLMKDDVKSKESIERLVKNQPDFASGVLELIVTYLDNHEYEKAKPFIDQYKMRKSFDQAPLRELLDLYPDYNQRE
jgi:tetratricopeptide (TPR) repeat protein